MQMDTLKKTTTKKTTKTKPLAQVNSVCYVGKNEQLVPIKQHGIHYQIA